LPNESQNPPDGIRRSDADPRYRHAESRCRSVTDNSSSAPSTFNLAFQQNESTIRLHRLASSFNRSIRKSKKENMANKWSDLAPWRQKQAVKK